MKAPQRKRRHDRRVAHQRIQRERKRTAIAESQHQARNLNGNGEPLKKPRSGEAYDRAFVKAMGERGYTLDYRGQWRRLPTADPIKKPGLDHARPAHIAVHTSGEMPIEDYNAVVYGRNESSDEGESDG